MGVDVNNFDVICLVNQKSLIIFLLKGVFKEFGMRCRCIVIDVIYLLVGVSIVDFYFLY